MNAKGVPVAAGGTLRLMPDKNGTTTVEITGEVKSSVPLVGGKLALFVGVDVQRTLHAEEAFNDGNLSAAATKPKHAPRSGTVRTDTRQPSATRSTTEVR